MFSCYYTFGAPMWDIENSDKNHYYTLFWEHGRKKVDATYSSRQVAEQEMFKIINRYHLSIKKQYDDLHFKTYILNDDSRMHINRL